MTTYDVAIVGGGIVGAACAAALSASGLSSILIEASGIASGSTSAGMGHIVVMDDSEAQFALTQYSQQLWNELSHELPREAEFDNCGTIWIATDDSEMAEVRQKNAYYSRCGIRTEILDQTDLSSAEPNIRYGLAGGLLVPDDSVVYQLTAARFLVQKAVDRGCELALGKSAVEITDGGVRLSDGQFISAGDTVNAAGSAAAELTSGLPIVKRKGHLIITERYPNFARHQLVELGYLKSAHGNASSSVAFNIQPRSTGQMIVGSSRQFGAEDTRVDYSVLRQLTSRAFEYMPAIRELSASRIWTGFRPSTPDNLPYIGKVPGYDHVFVAAGHEGLGITTSLGTAELIADAIHGRESAIPTDPYSPARRFKEH